MNTGMMQLAGLGIKLFIALLVWSDYKHATFALTKRYSTFELRFWSGFVDSCILWPIVFVTSALLSVNLPRGLTALLVITDNLAWLAYLVVMHACYGQTIGKMATKVRADNKRSHALTRAREPHQLGRD